MSYKQRMRDQNRCIICGGDLETVQHCAAHAEAARRYSRDSYQRRKLRIVNDSA